jgi:hypothetical protein
MQGELAGRNMEPARGCLNERQRTSEVGANWERLFQLASGCGGSVIERETAGITNAPETGTAREILEDASE